MMKWNFLDKTIVFDLSKNLLARNSDVSRIFTEVSLLGNILSLKVILWKEIIMICIILLIKTKIKKELEFDENRFDISDYLNVHWVAKYEIWDKPFQAFYPIKMERWNENEPFYNIQKRIKRQEIKIKNEFVQQRDSDTIIQRDKFGLEAKNSKNETNDL